MVRLISPTLIARGKHALKPCSFGLGLGPVSFTPHRALAQVRPDRELLPEICFTGSYPRHQTDESHKPPDGRTLRLGKTLQILQTRLPSLLASPLPQDILSPHITLHLFPSTHPHLPTASGRVAYHAALWTSPVAWGRMPLVGNVKLAVLSERVVKYGFDIYTPTTAPTSRSCNERLIVRWKTCGKTKGKGMGAFYRGIGAHEHVDKITEWLGGDVRDDEEFCGLFIFEFDEQGRILAHTIEHAEQTGNWDRTSRVVSVTDWLLGRMHGRRKEPMVACNYIGDERRFRRKDDDI